LHIQTTTHSTTHLWLSVAFKKAHAVIHSRVSCSSSLPRSNEKLSLHFCSNSSDCQRSLLRTIHHSNTTQCLFSHRKINHRRKYLCLCRAAHLCSQQGAYLHNPICFCPKLIFKWIPQRNKQGCTVHHAVISLTYSAQKHSHCKCLDFHQNMAIWQCIAAVSRDWSVSPPSLEAKNIFTQSNCQFYGATSALRDRVRSIYYLWSSSWSWMCFTNMWWFIH